MDLTNVLSLISNITVCKCICRYIKMHCFLFFSRHQCNDTSKLNTLRRERSSVNDLTESVPLTFLNSQGLEKFFLGTKTLRTFVLSDHFENFVD